MNPLNLLEQLPTLCMPELLRKMRCALQITNLLYRTALKARLALRRNRKLVNVLTKVNGRIVNYRTGIRTQMSRECLIQFEQFDSASLSGKLMGQKVLWKQGKSEISGKIVGMHGKNGMVRVRFSRGVPGQAIGTMVEVNNPD